MNSRRCRTVYLHPCLYPNTAQTYEQDDVSETTPANTVWTPNLSSSNCIALLLAKDEVLTELCEDSIPVADPQELETFQDDPIDITLTGSSEAGNFLFFEITTQPDHGTLTGSEDTYTYTPDPGYSGPDSFEFTVSNGTNTSVPAEITISVVSTSELGCLTVNICGGETTDCLDCTQTSGDEKQYIVNGFLSSALTIECPS